jgi:hypothetical protein
MRNDNIIFTVEAFDGAMKSIVTRDVNVELRYDPPKLSGPLEPRTVTVQQVDPYLLPKSVNGRNTLAGILPGPSFPIFVAIDTSATGVKVISSPGFTIPA